MCGKCVLERQLAANCSVTFNSGQVPTNVFPDEVLPFKQFSYQLLCTQAELNWIKHEL